VAAVAVLGLALSACLWWTYFGGDDTLAEQALTVAPPERRGRLAIEAFGHAELGLLLGVIAIAAGLEAGAHEPVHPLDLGHSVAIAAARPSTSPAMPGFASDCASVGLAADPRRLHSPPLR
jgi:low temperature requirement protein LtrA